MDVRYSVAIYVLPLFAANRCNDHKNTRDAKLGEQLSRCEEIEDDHDIKSGSIPFSAGAIEAGLYLYNDSNKTTKTASLYAISVTPSCCWMISILT